MKMRTLAARAPAMSLAEAAMLPALSREEARGMPANLLVPRKDLHFRSVESGGRSVDSFSRRRGSMAGRAVLKMVQKR